MTTVGQTIVFCGLPCIRYPPTIAIERKPGWQTTKKRWSAPRLRVTALRPAPVERTCPLPPNFDYRVEPLGASHDRASFRSGAPELDRYLHQQAGQDARRKVAAPFVLIDGAGSVLGYYTLSAYSVHLTELPGAIARKLPRYPLLPATLLGRLAIASSCRGRKLGPFLLMDALYRSWKNTSEVASAGVVVEALDDNARAFYLHHEFQSLSNHPDKLLLAMATIQKAFRAR